MMHELGQGISEDYKEASKNTPCYLSGIGVQLLLDGGKKNIGKLNAVGIILKICCCQVAVWVNA